MVFTNFVCKWMKVGGNKTFTKMFKYEWNETAKEYESRKSTYIIHTCILKSILYYIIFEKTLKWKFMKNQLCFMIFFYQNQ